MSDFRKLHVWRKAHSLALNSHRVAAAIRGAEYVSTRSQIIRAALSIPTNIVEGRGQKSAKEQSRFVGYAINSTSELEYHLLVCRDLKKITEGDFNSLLGQLVEVRKMLHGLLYYLSGQ